MVTFPITGDAGADDLLVDDPLALLIGMLLDQQVPMEWAFRGPATLRERLGDDFTAARIAAMDPDEFSEICRRKPAIHRFPGSMAARIHELCRHLTEHYGGDAAAIWRDVQSGDELIARLRELPGFGPDKTKIFLALLAKRFGIRPEGWVEAAAPFSDGEPRSAADVDSPASLERVREWKKMMKAANKTKSD